MSIPIDEQIAEMGLFVEEAGADAVPVNAAILATLERIKQAEQEMEFQIKRAENAALRQTAWDWAQGVDDAESAIRKLNHMFPIDTIQESTK